MESAIRPRQSPSFLRESTGCESRGSEKSKWKQKKLKRSRGHIVMGGIQLMSVVGWEARAKDRLNLPHFTSLFVGAARAPL